MSKKMKIYICVLGLILIGASFANAWDYLEIVPTDGISDKTSHVQFTVTVNARNSDGTLDASANTRLKFLCSEINATLPPDALGTRLMNGTGNFDVTLRNPLSPAISQLVQTITVRDYYFPNPSTDGTVNITIHLFVDHFEFSTPSPVIAGSTFTISVTARDITGAIATTFNDVVSFSAQTGNIWWDASAISFTNGVDNSIPIVLYGGAPGTRLNKIICTNSITYPSQSQAPNGTSDWITVNPGPFDRIILIFPGETLTPGANPGKTGVASDQTAGVPIIGVDAVAVDQWWNPLISVPASAPTLHFTSSDLLAGLPADTVMTNPTENFDNIITMRTAGPQDVTVQEDQNLTSSFSSFNVLSASYSRFEFDPIVSPQSTVNPFTIKITAYDPFDNVDISYNNSVTLKLIIGGSMANQALDTDTATPVMDQQITFVNGVWQGDIRTTKKALFNSAHLELSDGGINGISNNFTINAGPFTKLFIVLPGETYTPGIYPGKIGTPTDINAGDIVDVSVKGTDDYWNIVDDGSADVLITNINSTTGYVDSLDTPGFLVGGEEIFKVRYRTWGNQSISAVDSGGHSDTSTTLYVHPGPYNDLILVAPGETLQSGIQPTIEPDGKSGSPSNWVSGDLHSVDVVAVDSYFNPIEVAPPTGWPWIHFSSGDPGASLPSDTQMGPATRTFANLTLTLMGIQNIKVEDLGDLNKEDEVFITVIPGPVNSYQFNVISSPQRPGVAFNITITALDQHGSPTPINSTVDLTLYGDLGAFPLSTYNPTTVNVVAGSYSGAIVVDRGDTNVKIRATDGGGHSGESNSFNIQPLKTDYAKLVITLPGQSLTPGVAPGKTGTALPGTVDLLINATVTACDQYYNPINTFDVGFGPPNVHLSCDKFAIIPMNDVSLNNNGTRDFPMIFTVAGANLVTVVDNANGGITDNTSINISPASFEKILVIAPGETHAPGGNQPTGKQGIPANQTAGVNFMVSVLACDKYWNTVTSINGYHVDMISSDDSLTSTNPINNGQGFSNGDVDFNIYLGTIGNVIVTATVREDPLKTQSVTIPVGQGNYYEITYSPPVYAGPPHTFQMTIKLIDPLTGLPDPGANNAFDMQAYLTDKVTIGAGNLGYTTHMLTNGVVTFDQTYDKVEVIYLKVSDQFARVNWSNPIDVQYVSLEYSINVPDQATVGPPNTFPVTVSLLDSGTGNVVTTADRSFAVEIYDSSGILGTGAYPVTTATLKDGVASFNQSYTKAESIYLQVVDSSGVIKQSKTIDMQPDSYKKLQIVAPGESVNPGNTSATGKTGVPSREEAYEPFNVTVLAVDQFWNKVTTFNGGSIELVSSDGSLDASNPPNNYAPLSAGEATFNIKIFNKGDIVVTASDQNNLDKTPQSVTIPVRSYHYEIIVNVSSMTVIAGPPATFQITVRLLDDVGALVNSGIAINLTAYKPNMTPATGNLGVTTSNLIGGQVIINNQSYDVSEDIVIEVSDALNRKAQTPTLHVEAGLLCYSIEAPTEAMAGPPDSFSVTIKLLDANTGNIVPNMDRKVKITAYSAATGLPGSGLLGVGEATLQNGIITINETYTVAENIFLKAEDAQAYIPPSQEAYTSNNIIMRPGTSVNMQVNYTSTIECGDVTNIIAILTDRHGNFVPDERVHFKISDGDAKLAKNYVMTNALGEAKVALTAGTHMNGTIDMSVYTEDMSEYISIKVLGPPQTKIEVTGIYSMIDGKLHIKPNTTLELSSESKIGNVTVYYRLDGGDWINYNNTGTFIISDVGTHTIEYYGIDDHGHEELHNITEIYISSFRGLAEDLINYPNPFRAGREVTFIEYYLTEPSNVTLTIYDLLGQPVYKEDFSKNGTGGVEGENRITWDGRNSQGVVVGNGGYICELYVASDKTTYHRKIAVVK